MFHLEIRPRQVAMAAVVALVFVVGLVTVLQKAGSVTAGLFRGPGHTGAQSKTGEVKSINNANFDYLAPGSDPSWELDKSSLVYDQSRGVVKYTVKLKDLATDINISQQEMPKELKPRDSKAFQDFINSSKPVKQQLAGPGEVYFLPALLNGEPANGADTVIFATDDRLLFGRSGKILDYDTWALILATMTKKAPH